MLYKKPCIKNISRKYVKTTKKKKIIKQIKCNWKLITVYSFETFIVIALIKIHVSRIPAANAETSHLTSYLISVWHLF